MKVPQALDNQAVAAVEIAPGMFESTSDVQPWDIIVQEATALRRICTLHNSRYTAAYHAIDAGGFSHVFFIHERSQS